MVDSSPWVVLIAGPPGSGKSTTAREVARRLSAALLDLDTMTNPLVDVIADMVGIDDYADARLAEIMREPRYSGLLRVTKDCLSVGVAAVLVAPFSAERRDAAAWRTLADDIGRFGGRPVLAWLRLAPDELAKRLQARGAERDVAKLHDLHRYASTLNLDAPAGPHVAVDADRAPAEQADVILSAMESMADE